MNTNFVCKHSTYTTQKTINLNNFYQTILLKDHSQSLYEAYPKQQVSEEIMVEQIQKTDNLLPLISFVDYQIGNESYLITPRINNTITLRQFIMCNQQTYQQFIPNIFQETLCSIALLHERDIFGFRLSLDTIFVKIINQELKILIFKLFGFQLFHEGNPCFFELESNDYSKLKDVVQIGKMGQHFLTKPGNLLQTCSQTIKEMLQGNQTIDYFIQKLGITNQVQKLKQNQIMFEDLCSNYKKLKNFQITLIEHKFKNFKFHQTVETNQLGQNIQEMKDKYQQITGKMKSSIQQKELLTGYHEEMQKLYQQVQETETLLDSCSSKEKDILDLLKKTKEELEEQNFMMNQMKTYCEQNSIPNNIADFFARYNNHHETLFNNLQINSQYQLILVELQNRINSDNFSENAIKVMAITIEQYKKEKIVNTLSNFQEKKSSYLQKLTQLDLSNEEFFNETKISELNREKNTLAQKLDRIQVKQAQQGNKITILTQEYFSYVIEQIKKENQEITKKERELDEQYQQAILQLKVIGLYNPNNVENFRRNTQILSEKFLDKTKVKQIAWLKDQQSQGYEEAIRTIMKQIMLG